MNKYLFVYLLFWQEALSRRMSFFMERLRAVVVLISFYSLWSVLLRNRTSFAGYGWSQMMTYLMGMNVLRSVVFTSRTDEIPGEINHGRLSAYLIKPIDFMGYTFCRDLSDKSLNLMSSVIEIALLIALFHVRLAVPARAETWMLFALAAAGSVLLYFFLSFIVGCWGFWTAESGGPRFCLELFLEFTAGAFFPIDILPRGLQAALKLLPSPYLVFFPLQIFLEKLSAAQIRQALLIQMFWVAALAGLAQRVWNRGLNVYGAEGG